MVDHHHSRCSTPSLSSSTFSHNGRARTVAAWEHASLHSAAALSARRAVNVARIAANAGSCYGDAAYVACLY